MYNLQETIDAETKRVLDVYKEYKEKEIDPLADVGNPEEIIGKKYAQWIQQDVQALAQVYVYDIKPLEDFIAKKEIDRLWASEKQTRSLEV